MGTLSIILQTVFLGIGIWQFTLWLNRQVDKIRPKRRIPNVDTIADLIDRLIVDVHKLAWFENEKRKLSLSENPDPEKIMKIDRLSRDCCEIRSMLRAELNRALSEVINTRRYTTAPEVRTFQPPAGEITDLIDRMAHESATAYLTGELSEKLHALVA